MKIIHSVSELIIFRNSLDPAVKVALVPTMGALHSGHLALLTEAKEKADFVIISIFVNPLQFGQNEDLNKYPRTLEADLELCKSVNVDLVFIPNPEEIYPESQENITKIIPREKVANCLCGKTRPNHFAGVLTIVLKLFNLSLPRLAYFGEKDFQQLTLIRLMVKDLNLNIQIMPISIIRSDSGLALSSRNKYLNSDELIKASQIYSTLIKTAQNIKKGMQINNALEFARGSLTKEGFTIDYLEARSENDLEIINNTNLINLPFRLFIAVYFGANKTRLIDNLKVI